MVLHWRHFTASASLEALVEVLALRLSGRTMAGFFAGGEALRARGSAGGGSPSGRR